MSKQSITTTTTTSENLIKANASGNDTNLAEHGSNPYYLYSIGDGFRLALWLRQNRLNYEGMSSTKGEEYASSRENNDRVLVTDPYYAGSFQEYLTDDITRIMATGHFKTGINP